MALRYRNRTRKGLWVDIGMYQLGCYGSSEYILDWLANGRNGERIGNRHPSRAPQGCYPCAGQDQWCVISVGDDDEWAALCRVIGRDELALDPRLSDNLGRARNHDEIDEAISEWTGALGKFDVMERLQGAGVPAGPVFDARDTNTSKHYRSRGFLQTVEYPEERQMGKRVLMGRPWSLSKTPISIRGPAPTFGQNNREVIQDILGYDEARYDGLERAGIVGDRPTNPQPSPTAGMDDLVRLGRLAYHDPDYKDRLGIQD
jgi:crotonobetainyl-CoA:carnitine CoA-transferase CaiB-like acyl-CoA transferase